MYKTTFLILVSCLLWNLLHGVPPSYLMARDAIINTEKQERLGNQLTLNSREKLVNKFFLEQKKIAISDTRVNGAIFPPSENFFQSKKIIDQTPIFKIIEKMPKGCALHVHDSSIASLDWVISNVTYRANCYICFNETTGKPRLHFFSKPPANPGCYWESIDLVRKRFGDVKAFDQQLYNNFSIVVDNPNVKYLTVNDVWRKFNDYFGLLNGVFFHAPVFKDYFWQALTEFHQDNVQCLEIRATLLDLYELDGTIRDKDWIVQTFQNISKSFIKQNPDFLGVKIIYSAIRFSPQDVILSDVKDAMTLVQKYPDFVVGFDLVGQEGLGKTLLSYIDALLYPSQQSPPFKLNYFFHGGETDWQDTAVDYNLIDAILLNTSRIGHGFAINKHPYVREMMQQKGIAIEVNPISNQVLKLVDDMRNHPAINLMTGDFPVVISSDDPVVWAAKPLSHDFYMAYMALCGEDEDIRILKQLALNSIKYSSMTEREKSTARHSWIKLWNEFIESMAKHYNFLINHTILG